MKKLLLTFLAIATLSTSTFAAEDSLFYLRADAGFNSFNKVTIGMKKKAQNTGDFSLGVGYMVMDNVRAEIAYAYYFTPTRKGSGSTTLANSATQETNIINLDSGLVTVANGQAQAGDATSNTSIKTKAKLQTIMLKGYYDVADLGAAKVFIGAGVGMTRLQEKISASYSGTVDGQAGANQVTAANADKNTKSAKLKAKNNFSWLLGVGAGFEVTDAVTVDLQYNFQDFGKSATINNKKKSNSHAYRSHAIKAGVRFDI